MITVPFQTAIDRAHCMTKYLLDIKPNITNWNTANLTGIKSIIRISQNVLIIVIIYQFIIYQIYYVSLKSSLKNA